MAANMSVDEYVEKSKRLLKLENDEEINYSQQLQSTYSPAELEEKGRCLLKLRVSQSRTGLYGRTLVSFVSARPPRPVQKSGDDTKEASGDKDKMVSLLPASRISVGDIVGLYSAANQFGAPPVASGVVTCMTRIELTVAFEEIPDDDELPEPLSIALLANEVTHNRLTEALEELRTYRDGPAAALREVLFGYREPDFSQLDTQSNTAFSDPVDTSMNGPQLEAIQFALSARHVALIHGPPGTGKTTTVVELIRQAVRRGLRVLACAPSNIAVDNLVEKLARMPHTGTGTGGSKSSSNKIQFVRLGHPARLLPSVLAHSLDALIGSADSKALAGDVRKEMDTLAKEIKKSRDKSAKRQMRFDMRNLARELRKREEEAFKEVLNNSDVVFATCVGAKDARLGRSLEEAADSERGVTGGKKPFDLVIIDEAAQATEAACWIPLLMGRRCVLAGDHKQLPPTVKSVEAEREGLGKTLFDRLTEMYGQRAVRMLTVQYRMNDKIMDWSSNEMYHGRLTADAMVAKHLLKDLVGVKESDVTATPLLLIDTNGCDMEEAASGEGESKANEGEAALALVHVMSLLDSGIREQDIGVITPYNGQVELLRERLAVYPKIEISSVDGFQGREKECIVISLVRSNGSKTVGFLSDDRRLNVAVTRARRHVTVICDSETVSSHPFLERMVAYFHEHGEVRSAMQFTDNPNFVQGGVSSIQSRPRAQRPDQVQVDSSQKKAQPRAKPSQPAASAQPMTQDSNRFKFSAEKPQRTAEEDQQVEDELRAELVGFLQNKTETERHFSSSLSSFHRMKIHALAEELGLGHGSKGEGSDRHVSVWKISKTSKATSKMEFVSEEDAAELLKETTQMITPVSDTAGEEDKQKKKKKKKKKKKSNEQNGGEEEMCVAVESEEEEKEEVSPPIPDTVTVQPAVAVKLTNKKSTTPAAVPDEDIDALLDAAIADNKYCGMKGCQKSTQMLGRFCPFCRKKFCFSHNIPEVHGCGDDAKKHARADFAKSFDYKVLGKEAPKPLKTWERDHLANKLHKKITATTTQRTTQNSKEKSKKK